MATWIALFRGINVGGHGRLPMKELVAILEELGLSDVKTYIQSGNVVFRSRASNAGRLADRIARAVESSRGFRPQVVLLTADALRHAADASPFPKGEAAMKTVHLCFLAEPSTAPDFATMDRVKSATEEYALIDDVFYLHAPDGIARSKLAAQVERCLGVPTTSRNWRTVERVLALAETP